ncbi:hypothetical protein BCU31_025210 [Vibrio lentus]|uniref:DUF7146 domain-containing protein n=1 Tax=Vibrio lentus TaxID=136468 RepID=UPI0039A61EA8
MKKLAKDYINQSLPMDNTLAQTYLNKLGVNNIENNQVKFHPAVYSSEDESLHPAMLTNIHNKEGETKAIEVTYLDTQGNKDTSLDINPQTFRTKSGTINPIPSRGEFKHHHHQHLD